MEVFQRQQLLKQKNVSLINLPDKFFVGKSKTILCSNVLHDLCTSFPLMLTKSWTTHFTDVQLENKQPTCLLQSASQRTEERGKNLDGNDHETCARKHLCAASLARRNTCHLETGQPMKAQQNTPWCCRQRTDSQALFVLKDLLVKVEVSKIFHNKCPIFRLWIRGKEKSKVRG